MKKLVLAVILPFVILCFFASLQAATQEEILKNPELYPERGEYEKIFLGNLRDQSLSWPEKCRKIIIEYRLFIAKYPFGEFVDDAKLRIAELYELSYQKERALLFLDDIIENHPYADYFSLSPKYENGAKTAGWALYYRGLWFKRPEDLQRLIKEYPENKKAVKLAKTELIKFSPPKKTPNKGN